ncbi:MAG: glycosyltransferase family 2 protein [Anaerolineae bacterium]|nr:glycosyltransferase family 2 protein [Anaerolineae bacterium]
MSNLAVVIVNWNTRDITLQAIRSLVDDLSASGPPETEIWVLDNASSDGSVDAIRSAFPQVWLIASETNLGFAGGNNAVLRAIGFPNGDSLPRAVYLLNSDTITHAGSTRTLYDALFSLSNAGVVGARLTFGDGSFQHSAFHFPGLAQLWMDLLPAPGRLYESALNGRYPHCLYEGKNPFPVDHTLGATMMLKHEVIQQTGLFDEQFLMYCEEIDWMWRIRQAGWEIYCVPAAHITHLGGQSTGQVRPRSLINLWESRLLLYQKYYPRWKNWLAKHIIRQGIKHQMRQTQNNAALTESEQRELLAAYQHILEKT